MRNLSTILLAVALMLGLAQCKKEQPTPQSEGNVVTITLNVDGNNGSRVNVDPTGENQVTFTGDDQILVASDGKYVGTLTKDGGTFSGTVSAGDLVDGQPLYFYFLGNKADVSQLTAGSSTTCTVNISDQTTEAGLPVISMGRSIDPQTGNIVKYASGMTSFSSRLYNKCSLQKFNVTTSSTNDICITGMNNTVTVDFGKPNETGDGLGNLTNNGFSYSKDTDDNGLIKMKGQEGDGDKTYWVIVLPQAALTETGEAYSVDNSYTGTRPTIHAIESNKWYHEGDDVISMTLTAAAPTHEYVDLGLPNGTLWATCNVGADSPEDYGDYFAWGETQPKDTYNWDTYQYRIGGDDGTLTKYCNNSDYGYNGFTDDLTTLLPEDDAATANLGSDWRMPTKEEWEELYNNTTHTWTTQNGVSGRLFTASNGNSLFLPAAGERFGSSLYNAGGGGYYRSSSLYTVPDYAWTFYFNSNSTYVDYGDRHIGRSVRAVRSPRQN